MLPMLASLDSFVIAYTQSDLFGKLIMIGLFGLSILCWVVLLHKVWMVRKVRNLSLAFQQACVQNQEQLLKLDLSNLPRPQNQAIPHPFAQIFHTLQSKTVDVLKKNHYFLSQQGSQKNAVFLTPEDIELLQSCAITTISQQNKILEKNIFILSTIMTLAPFMGLLGTVWGILVTFSGLQAGSSAGSNAAILSGLSTALSTTVLGLIIAIPALVAYNYLRNSLHRYYSEMDDFQATVLSAIEMQYRKVE